MPFVTHFNYSFSRTSSVEELRHRTTGARLHITHIFVRLYSIRPGLSLAKQGKEISISAGDTDRLAHLNPLSFSRIAGLHFVVLAKFYVDRCRSAKILRGPEASWCGLATAVISAFFGSASTLL